jgi:CRISPR system Cascade subunit CasA
MTSDSTPAFNLLDEPWIPVQTHTGEVYEVSLTDALLNARDYTALAETSPPNLIALYRLLLAVLHRALTTQHGPWKDADRARWFREGLPELPIRNYLEHWRDRFWLFHSTHPFMQVAVLAEAEETRDTKTMRPWAQLTLDYVSGNAPVVFDHSIDDNPEQLTPARALRHLLGYLQFVPGGMVRRFRFRDESGPLDNVAAVLPVGKTLSQTLCLALHPWSRNAIDDLPPWETEPPSAKQLREAKATLPTGEVDRYTRLTRSVLFHTESARNDKEISIRHVRFAAGLTMTTHDPGFPDGMAAYRKRGDNRISPVTFQDGRALWRDLPVLLPTSEQTYFAPAVVSNALNCLAFAGSDGTVSFIAAGTASDPVQCKVFRWRTERIDLPHALIASTDAVAEIRSLISLAEGVYFRKGGLSWTLAEFVRLTLPDPNSSDTRERARTIRDKSPAAAVFFSTAERALPKLMHQIAAGDIDAADRDWKATLVEAAKQSWEATHRSLGDSPAALRADARTYPRFSGLLKSLVQSITETTAEEAAA